jgi:hypothetical protein
MRLCAIPEPMQVKTRCNQGRGVEDVFVRVVERVRSKVVSAGERVAAGRAARGVWLARTGANRGVIKGDATAWAGRAVMRRE